MEKQNEALTTLLHLLSKIESDAVKARHLIQKLYGDQGISVSELASTKPTTETSDDGENIKVIEGSFDGNFMQG